MRIRVSLSIGQNFEMIKLIERASFAVKRFSDLCENTLRACLAGIILFHINKSGRIMTPNFLGRKKIPSAAGGADISAARALVLLTAD